MDDLTLGDGSEWKCLGGCHVPLDRWAAPSAPGRLPRLRIEVGQVSIAVPCGWLAVASVPPARRTRLS